jgi:hypothetical protein
MPGRHAPPSRCKPTRRVRPTRKAWLRRSYRVVPGCSCQVVRQPPRACSSRFTTVPPVPRRYHVESAFPREYLQYHQYPAWGDVLGSGFEIESNPRSSRRYCRRLRENKENSSQDRSLRTSPLSRASRDAAAIALQCRHDWRKYPARVSHPSRRMRQRFKLRSTSSSFSPVEIKAKIGDRNIRNTLLAGAACLLSLALGGVLEPLFKKYPNHPGYSWSRTSRVANFATESNR